VISYLRRFADEFGTGWTKFWFTPRDPFTLCALRILTGLSALYWVASFSFDLLRFLGPQGLLSVEAVNRWRSPTFTHFSYFDYFSTSSEVWVAHVIGILVLVLFTAGCFTRWTSILSLVVVISYIHRNPMITSEIEPLLCALLFYLCFAPCGAALSVDALRRKRRAPLLGTDSPIRLSCAATISTRLIQLHLCAAYVMMTAAKLNTVTWWDGTSVWILFSMPDSRMMDLSLWLEEHFYISDFLTHGILIIEGSFAALIWFKLWRPLILTLACLSWLLIALATGKVAFCLLMIMALLAFVAPDVLRGILGRAAQGSRNEAVSRTAAA
jgi:hypothetical protein